VTGEYDLNANDGFEQNISIEKIISHPGCNPNTWDYDVAFVKVIP